MSGATKIEWTDATWNPFRGCSRTSPGCQNCYAERLAARFSYEGGWGEGYAEMTEAGPRWTRKVSVVESNLAWPIRYKGHPDAIDAGRATRIFVNSTSDIAHESLEDEDIDAAFAAMVLAQAHNRQHVFQALTKRSERLRAYIVSRFEAHAEPIAEAAARHFGDQAGCDAANSLNGTLGHGRNAFWPPQNVWLGASIEDRARKDRIAALRATPAALRFLSLEPLLEDLGDIDLRGISWVIVGGESGQGARDCDLRWIRNVVKLCRVAGIPVFVKQVGSAPLGSCCDVLPPNADFHDTPRYRLPIRNRKGGDPSEWPEDLRIQEYPRWGLAA